MTIVSKYGFVYNEYNESLEIYSPYCGLCFSIPKNDSCTVKKWLNDIRVEIPNKYKSLIGSYSIKDIDTTSKTIQVNVNDKKDTHHISVINWLLTTKCNFKCKYCYGQSFTPDMEMDIRSISRTILSYSPIAVVLSGGEPLLNKKYREVISSLFGKTGIIFDTNGSLLTENDIDYLKKNNVMVRISLDSTIVKNNEKSRISDIGNYTHSLMKTIESCINTGLHTTIHTVVSRYNEQDLLLLKHYLEDIGVKNWKLIQLANVSRNNDDILPLNDIGDFLSNKYYDEVRKSTDKLYVTIQKNDEIQYDRSVILVAPNGDFFTRTKHGNVLIDQSNTKHPDLTKNTSINHNAHYKRYIIDLK